MGNTIKQIIQYWEFCREKKEGETQIIRHPTTAKGELRQTMDLGIKTMWDIFEYNLLWVQQSPDIASTIDAISFFGDIASIVDVIFGKAKIYKLFVDFCFAKIVNYFLILYV